MISPYVLSGLSEEKQDENRALKLEEKKRRVQRELEKVNRELDKATAKQKMRMQEEMRLAKSELERVKLRLSSDPYRNGFSLPRNFRNQSRLGRIAFTDSMPTDKLLSTSHSSFQRHETKERQVLEKLNKTKGICTSFIDDGIRFSKQ